MPPDALAERLHARLLADGPRLDAARIRVDLERLAWAEAPLLPADDVRRLVDQVVARVGGLGPLDPLLADPHVTEVMVNGTGGCGSSAGRLERADPALDGSTTEHLIERVVGPLGPPGRPRLAPRRRPPPRRLTGQRRRAPLAIDGPCLTIRRFGARAFRSSGSARLGVGRPAGVGGACPAQRPRLGGTGAGKTTLLNAPGGRDPRRRAGRHRRGRRRAPTARQHVVRLEARPANAEGAGG